MAKEQKMNCHNGCQALGFQVKPVLFWFKIVKLEAEIQHAKLSIGGKSKYSFKASSVNNGNLLQKVWEAV